jgi:hypothetical protein
VGKQVGIMAYEIIDTILETLRSVLTVALQLNVPPTDPLRLRTITLEPLQDDPTTTAPSCIIGLDHEKGRQLLPPEYAELGTPATRWINYFQLRGYLPQRSTKEEAYRDLGELADRVVATLIKNFDLDGITADNGEAVSGCNKLLVDQQQLRVFGGESEWYGEYTIRVHYKSERPVA